MVKRHFIALGMLVAALIGSVAAQAEGTYLNVHLKSGAIDSYALDQKPEVTFPGGVGMIFSCAGVETAYNVADVESYTFGEMEGIDNPAAESGIVFEFADNLIKVQGAVTGVTVTDINGVALKSVEADGDVTIDVADLQPAVYIVTINNNKSVKILKK